MMENLALAVLSVVILVAAVLLTLSTYPVP